MIESVKRVEEIKMELIQNAHSCGDYRFYELNREALEGNAWILYQERYSDGFKF